MASDLKVNVNFNRCKKAKKLVNEKLVENYKKEFVLLLEYANELLNKNYKKVADLFLF